MLKSKLKYIVLEDPKYHNKVMVLFPIFVNFSTIKGNSKAISGGFCYIDGLNSHFYGKANSISISSNPLVDYNIFLNQFYNVEHK